MSVSEPGRIEGADQGGLSWSAIALRQEVDGEQASKMYMKLRLSKNREGIESHKTVSMTLV